MRVYHQAMIVLISILLQSELKRFLLKVRNPVECKGQPQLVSYCCDITDAKDMSTVRKSVAVKRPHIKSMVYGEDIVSHEFDNERSVRETKTVKIHFLEISTKDTGSVNVGIEVCQEEEAD